LIANIQQHQYVTEVGTTAGLVVLVQPQDMMPFPEDRGKLVSPGYQTEFAITQVLQYKKHAIFQKYRICHVFYLYFFNYFKFLQPSPRQKPGHKCSFCVFRAQITCKLAANVVLLQLTKTYFGLSVIFFNFYFRYPLSFINLSYGRNNDDDYDDYTC